MAQRRGMPLGIELELLAGREDFGDPLLRARTRFELDELPCQIDPRTVRGAAAGQHGEFVARNAAEKLVHQAALAEARLRGDCDDLSVPRTRPLEALSEMSKLQRSPYKCGRPAQ